MSLVLKLLARFLFRWRMRNEIDIYRYIYWIFTLKSHQRMTHLHGPKGTDVPMNLEVHREKRAIKLTENGDTRLKAYTKTYTSPVKVS